MNLFKVSALFYTTFKNLWHCIMIYSILFKLMSSSHVNQLQFMTNVIMDI
jgi:hypothetical protein